VQAGMLTLGLGLKAKFPGLGSMALALTFALHVSGLGLGLDTSGLVNIPVCNYWWLYCSMKGSAGTDVKGANFMYLGQAERMRSNEKFPLAATHSSPAVGRRLSWP